MKRLVLIALGLGVVAADAQTVRTNPGFQAYKVPRNDDGSGPATPLGFSINFFGKTRTSLWVNNNGNVTFDSPLSTYTPFGLEKTQREIIAPFFADVDTRGNRSLLVSFGPDTVNGRHAFGATYVDVGYYNTHDDKLNSFQVVLVDRSDTGPGNFDIEFNYDRIVWETGDASGGANGFGGVSASVGWSNGSGDPGTSFELAGSRIPGSFLDGATYSLVRRRQNSSVGGRSVFRARDGMILPGLMISTGCPLPPATLNVPYRQQLATLGGMPPYRWSLDADPGVALPGLSMSGDGVVAGTPNVLGEFEFTLHVTGKGDEGDETAVRRCSIKVLPQQLSVTSACPLPAGTVAVPYSASVKAAGGPGPYSWNVTDGALPPGVSISTAGSLSGVPTATGTYGFMLQVAGTSPDVATPAAKACSVTIHPPGLRSSLACPLPSGTTGVPYSAALSAAGGVGPYTWSAVGNLPPGLSLLSDGRIVGMPLVAAPFPFTLRVADSRGQGLVQACSITVAAPSIQITTACPLIEAVTGSAYKTALAASGGSGPYKWSVLGTLPAGLTLDPRGAITGLPLNAGATQFRLLVEDSQGLAAAEACSLSVGRGAVAVTACPLPEGRVGELYSRLLSAAGGLEPYDWSVTGTFPAGLAYSKEGAITGTPSVSGTFPLRLVAVDSRLNQAVQSCNLTVQPQAPKIATACPLPPATVGSDYAMPLEALDGAPPYNWAMAGALPAGVTLASGRISGRPQAVGSFDFSLRLNDSRSQSAARDCSLRVSLPDLPGVRLSAVPAAWQPASPASIAVELSSAYSLSIQGVVSLTVSPDTAGFETGSGRADPRLRFARGQKSASFSIPAGGLTATIPLMSTGTVAGTAEFRITELRAGGVNISSYPPAATARIPRMAPVITDACFTGSSTGIELAITGYSTSRDLSKAGVQLSAAQGATIESPNLTVDVSGVTSDWFASDDSVRFGGAFTLRLPVAIQGGANSVSSAAVTLTNAAGTSTVKNAQRCP